MSLKVDKRRTFDTAFDTMAADVDEFDTSSASPRLLPASPLGAANVNTAHNGTSPSTMSLLDRSKRARLRTAEPASSSGGASTSQALMPPQRPSAFPAVGSGRIMDGLDQQLPRRLRRKLTAERVGDEVTLSMPDVRQLVECALELQEARLREQYDRILQEQLQEQFESFTRFNAAHLSRIVSDNDFSYCS
eukprot:TRINITY_DN320_c0_g1_i4.p1 TRINITY_DN320_c0_g1~~TRINITY_DN320_c0_g1_i4.p1  ORF type:complete len:209 (-),score=76.45 TRINITY_DN320_c0_g1_i4:129-701(-)